MIHVERRTPATPQRVWAVLSDLDRWDQLLPTMDSVRSLDGGAPREGARYEVRQPKLPTAVWEVTVWRPEAGFTWVSQAAGVTATATHTIVPDGDGTRLLLGVTWTGAIAPVMRLLLTKTGRRMVEQEADTLVRLAEQGPAPS